MMGKLVDERRHRSRARLDALERELGAANDIIADKACVYLTGSFGRMEASEHSDLDLFIVGTTTESKDGVHRRNLSRLDEICLKADLIRATHKVALPPFSGDGEYLEHYTVADLVQNLGTPEDDACNAFTARLLLLLESRPLLGNAVYDKAVGEVIAEYWKDYADHHDDFVPAFLANDILRLWRTFCVNYEARTAKEPEEKKAKRKLKNYKLKHSRLLTCYSALAYLLAKMQLARTVTPADAREMAAMTPIERLEWLIENHSPSIESQVNDVFTQYTLFLQHTDASEERLIEVFLDRGKSQRLMADANRLGDAIFELLRAIGGSTPPTRLYRLFIV